MAPKQTRLDDNAEIYKRRDPQSERQKLSEMSGPQKVTYFKQYYLKKLLATLVIVGFLVYLLVTMFRPKPDTILSLAFVNYPAYTEQMQQLEAQLKEYYNIDEKTQEIRIDTGYDLKGYDYASAEKLTTYMYAGDIDVFIAPESQFLKYAFSNCMSPLTDLLPTDMYSELQSRLFSCKTRLDDEETPAEAQGPEGVFGLYATDLPLFSEYDTSIDPPVIGIIISGENKENAVEFLRFLFNIEAK